LVFWQDLVICQPAQKEKKYVSDCYLIAFDAHSLLASLLHNSDGHIESTQEVRDDLSNKYFFRNQYCSNPGIDFAVNTFISPRRWNS
jgi:hypothetical protein